MSTGHKKPPPRARELMATAIQEAKPFFFEGGGTGKPGNILEEYVGAKGSNRDGSDCSEFDSKFHGGKSLVTLFHLSPDGGVDALEPLIDRYGKVSKTNADKRTFRHTISNRSKLFRIFAHDRTICVRPLDKNQVVARWTEHNIEAAIGAKLRRVLLGYGNVTRNLNGTKQVVFTGYRYLTSFVGVDQFVRLVYGGTVAIDFDAHQINDDAVRDHGTKFRIRHRDLGALYGDIFTYEDGVKPFIEGWE